MLSAWAVLDGAIVGQKHVIILLFVLVGFKLGIVVGGVGGVDKMVFG